MAEVSTIGLDIAKSVFHAHGADASGRVVFSRRLTRARLLDFFAQQAPCVVALGACGGAHHWAREISALGHDVRPAKQPSARVCALPRSRLKSSRPRPWCFARATFSCVSGRS